MPLYPSPQVERQEKRRMNFSSAVPSDLDSDGVALIHRSKFPIFNIPSTLDKQTNWTKALPLPTPEERMKCNSQVIASCVIPINVTGVGFDRDASVRCSLVHSQSVLQRRRKLRRRKTVAGVPRQMQRDLDSDDSPGSRERTLIVHTSPDITPFSQELPSNLSTRDSGCQTEELLISGAPSRRRIKAQRNQGVSLTLSHSEGNITSLPDSIETMFTSSVGVRLRSQSLPRDTSRTMDIQHHESYDDNEEDELSPFNSEGFLPGPIKLILKDEEESTHEQAMTAHQLGSLKYKQLSASPECSWMEHARSHLPRKVDLGSCEISSSSDTFSSPVHMVSTTTVLGSQMDHKDEHQSSSGNWSGSSSTCPSQTSETIPPAASPPLTGSSHCDSELSLNATGHANDDQTGFMLDHYQGPRTQRADSFSSTAMDILEEVGVSTPVDGDWSYFQPEPSNSQNFSPEPSREAESSLGCPSFTSMATCESSFSDRPPSEKADNISHYSVDTEGYYTSMHFDCGLKGSRSFTYNYAPCGSDRSLFELIGPMTLGRRCLSLRKSKAKPSPPKRSSSLRKIYSEGNLPDRKEPTIICGEQLPLSGEKRLQLCLFSSAGQTENSSFLTKPLVAFGVQSSSDFPDLGVLSTTHARSFKDEGAMQSDYADLWLLNDLKSSDPYRSLSNSSTATSTTVIECIKSQESSESQTSLSGSRATTPSLPSVDGEFKLTSPEKLAGLASPSSGYSSQSETPTSSFPSTFFPGPFSPTSGKRKPKVPERKSSLSSRSLQSLSCRDVTTSKKELELPIIPPSQRDLSALHTMNKALAYRTQIQILHQNKQKLELPAKHLPPSNSEVFNSHSLFITPSVLHSVQLRCVSKDLEDKHEAASGLHSAPVNMLSGNQSVKLKNSLPNNSLLEMPSEELGNSVFTSNYDFTSGRSGCQLEMSSNVDREPPSESVTAEGLQLDLHVPPLGTQVPEGLEGLHTETNKEKLISCEGLSSQSEALQQQQPELFEDEACPSPPILHSSPKRWSNFYEVPATDGESAALRVSPIVNEGSNEVESDSSDVLAQSTLHDSKEKMEESSTQDTISSDSAASPPHHETRPEEDGMFLSSTKARTTEDLFAMIHRSKRKVLGRKDSAELGVRNRLVTPSGNTPPSSTVSSLVSMVTSSSQSFPSPPSASSVSSTATPPSSQRVSGPIYRNAKKSSTSNEEFKLLLLKKGSRSESSYRMSATEILKSPIVPKSPGDSLMESPRQPEEPVSPLQSGQEHLSNNSNYPKANIEGFSLKPSSPASRQGRSRIPPPANSSRYSMRSRLYSAPMQAISEGETENSDGSPHDDHSSQGSM